jgi:hypothetical protein
MKEALSHILFIGVIVFAASYLKKDTKSTTLAEKVQDSTIAPALVLQQRDTTKLHVRK